MENQKNKVLGKRVLIERDRLDAGGMTLGLTLEACGIKNQGTIVEVGNIGIIPRLRGVKKGAKVLFNRHFIPNNVDQAHGEAPLVFVEVDQILAIIN